MNSGNNNLSWQERLGYEFRRNKSKSVILTILLVVGLVMVAKLVFKKTPVAAQGGSPGLVAAQANPDGPAPSLAGPGQGESSGEKLVAGGGSRTLPNSSRPPVAVKVEFLRDIFRPDPVVFTAKEDSEASTPDDARIQVRLEANALRLTSTMVGEVSCVTVNGQLLRINDWVDGFQVLSISKGSCVVIKKGIRIQLDMES
ncbi:MAG: hypothetical protein WCK05_11460 [Planctomycetota bacterium]